jgi:hypothetical protein
MIALMMEAVNTSDTPMIFYHTKRRSVTEGYHLYLLCVHFMHFTQRTYKN